jgi:hypothetical protein
MSPKTLTRQQAAFDFQRVGMGLVHAQSSRTRSAKKVNPPDTSKRLQACCFGCMDQLRRAGVDLESLVIDFLQRFSRHAFEQGHAAAQAVFEIGDFTAHRGFGNGCDFCLFANRVGNFVNAFNADERGVHVKGDGLETSSTAKGGAKC